MEENVKEAAKSIHELNVVHGDLTGRNILVDKEQKVWIIDFEYSSITDDQSAKNSEMRSLGYELEKIKHGDDVIGRDNKAGVENDTQKHSAAEGSTVASNGCHLK